MKQKNSNDQKHGTVSLFIKESNERNQSVTLKVLCDLTLFILVTVILHFINYITPFRRGFFCDDEDIMYPDRKGNVGNLMQRIIYYLIPTVVILLTEIVWFLKGKDSDENKFFICNWRVPNVLCRIYSEEGIYLFGVIMTQIIKDYIKIMVGRNRPSFFVACRPDFNCSSVENRHFYVETFNCTHPKLKSENYLGRSFPSGHSACATFAMLYIALYLQRRMYISFGVLLKPLIQLSFLSIAVYVAIAKIQDYKHHWDDVVAGFIIGLILCLITVFTQTNLFKDKKSPSLNQEHQVNVEN